MIGRLRGVLLEKRPPWLLLECAGVGYEVEAPMSTFYHLPGTGEEVVLHTHLQVRDDAHLLYGFASEAERGLFRDLLKVSGVGAKMALAVLSGMTADEFALCIQEGDVARLTSLPGIGKKTAERLIVEMRDRLGEVPGAGATLAGGADGPAPDPVADAVSALIALGYKPQEASRQVRALDTDGLDSETIIRLALKAMVR
ncbi:MAG: Holliday junction branch migration protein RuvA [Gammaproteobacteria bacterium]|nr:MAG: Holliday junction branch migration protein RuvA [Gammaproteobacteria bacterium]